MYRKTSAALTPLRLTVKRLLTLYAQSTVSFSADTTLLYIFPDSKSIN